jgi:sec-independent protein translocase protein TatA
MAWQFMKKGGHMFGLGVMEIAIISVIALLFFGPSRLPQLGKSVGSAISGFRSAISGKEGGEQGKS